MVLAQSSRVLLLRTRPSAIKDPPHHLPTQPPNLLGRQGAEERVSWVVEGDNERVALCESEVRTKKGRRYMVRGLDS